METLGCVMAGRFRIGRTLGAGGMGTVHEAIDLAIDRPVALKLLRTELASDDRQLQRFEREARAAARLSHPNIVGVTELVRDDALGLGLVMELLVGTSLAGRLEEGPLAESEAVHVFMQALDGLAAAHAAGMVHRDLKPSNLFLVPIAGSTLVKILDFGIVKLAEDGAQPKLTRKGALIGTPTYMSPEQISCDSVDARSDIYSMGACLYEALVAQPPYLGAHPLELIAAVGAGPPRDVRELGPDVSPDLAHITRVAMSRDPNGRYQTAAAMREALRGAVVGPPSARPVRTSKPADTAETQVDLVRSRARMPVAVAAAVVVFVTLVLLAAWLALLARGAHEPSTTSARPASIEPVHTPRIIPAPVVAAPVDAPPSPRGDAAPPPVRAPRTPRSHAPQAPAPRAMSPPSQVAPPDAPPRSAHIGEDVIDPFAH